MRTSLRVLVVTGSNPARVRQFGGDGATVPCLPLAYPFYGGLRERGCVVELATLSAGFFRGAEVVRLVQQLRTFDVAVAWGMAGPVLALAAAPFGISRRICTFLYAHATPRASALIRRCRDLVIRAGLQAGGVAMYMTARQAAEAPARFGIDSAQVAYCPVGVDTRFFVPLPVYAETPVRADLAAFTASEYVVMAGDQLRDDLRIAEMLVGTGLRLVRLSQEPRTEAFWRWWQAANRDGLEVFCAARLKFEEVRYAYQRALCVLNLVDNSWQPAGWTVTTEAMACGVPIIMNRGLTTEELARYARGDGASPVIEVDSLTDTSGVREALLRLRRDPVWAQKRGAAGRTMVETYLDIDRMADTIFSILVSRSRGGA